MWLGFDLAVANVASGPGVSPAVVDQPGMHATFRQTEDGTPKPDQDFKHRFGLRTRATRSGIFGHQARRETQRHPRQILSTLPPHGVRRSMPRSLAPDSFSIYGSMRLKSDGANLYAIKRGTDRHICAARKSMRVVAGVTCDFGIASVKLYKQQEQ